MAKMIAAHALMTPEAVRERAHELFALGLDGALMHWTVDIDRLSACADLVASVIRQRYPSLDVPFHARWRHINVGGVDRWGAIRAEAGFASGAEEARAAFDLAIVSVLLDAGAGGFWGYRDRSGRSWARSEGLAVASVDMFQAGAFSTQGARYPFRADAKELRELKVPTLARGFQAGEDNPLVGVEGRTELLNRVGQTVLARPALFETEGGLRPGGLFDHLARRAENGALPAREILLALLDGFSAIWPGRESLGGFNLGDCWRHPSIRRADVTDGYVPFHKLSQWLAYSLIEPLEAAGIRVNEVDALTGLAEYRNGGLFVDAGVIALVEADAVLMAHAPSSELVVEWRALTIALLDEIAPLIRERLGITADAFPLAKVLEGGTWWAGRKLAAAARADGGPPIAIESDGTVF